MKRPELPQRLLDILYIKLNEATHEKIYEMFLAGEKEKQDYKEFYYTVLWQEEKFQTKGDA